MTSKNRWVGWYWGDRETWQRYARRDLVPYGDHLVFVDSDGVVHKADKLPINVRTMRAASVSDNSTWSTFEDACNAMREERVEGVGYVLDDNEAMVDIDGCVSESGASEFAKACIYKFDSYTEVSASGRGIHILLVVDGFVPDRGYKGSQCEVYVGGYTNRYCTVTGSLIDGHVSLNDDATDVLEDFYDQQFEGRQSIDYGEIPEIADDMPTRVSDEHAVAWALGHYARARDLYLRGDITKWAEDRKKYRPSLDRSRSEADWALACYLLAATEGNVAQTHRLLCKSGMYYKKYAEIHDGKNPYSVMTVARAARTTDVVESRKRAMDRRDKVIDRYPDRLAELVDLMKRDDVTDHMLRRIMATRANGAARRRWKDAVPSYPMDLVRWITDRWPRVVQLAYEFDFDKVVRWNG